MVKPADQARGEIVCSHIGCGQVNVLTTSFYYDENKAKNLPGFGRLVYTGNPAVSYPIRYGLNSLGTSETCTVRMERYLHDNRCFISRRHCTLTVVFDKWSGQFRYQLQDGAVEPGAAAVKPSLNGTFLEQIRLLPTDVVDVPDGGLITLGGIDTFRLEHVRVSPAVLETYKIPIAFDPDQTQ
ncbi:hypothetical protein BLX24_21920 [Arsenicibacter rosenii]|uniref:FHA domain-containing protein n=2 Tax=Arsenicibacter rosenii TaxID=1750698 RepID=A0A1S2VE70_9BACT|nr:hypothetical protein BLX24_21920 [Arsenicibacter rosenii]